MGTSRETVIRFVGGPLDGTERRKTRPARIPLFLTVSGDPLRAASGDRITGAIHGIVSTPRSGPQACYAQHDDTVTAARRIVTYRFITTDATPGQGVSP